MPAKKYEFEFLQSVVALTCGMVGIAFMKEDPEEALRVRRGIRNHLNVAVAGDIAAGSDSTLLGWIKPLLATATREFASSCEFKHCELAFKLNSRGQQRFGPDKMLAVAIEQGSGVQIKPRHFHSDYKWQWIKCNVEQMQGMLFHCFATQGQPFSTNKMNRTVTNPGPERRDSWFCVFHVMSCLQLLEAPLFHLTRCNTLTIDELYLLVDQAQHLPEQTSQMMAPHRLEEIYGKENVHKHIYAQQLAATAAPTRVPRVARDNKNRTKKSK